LPTELIFSRTLALHRLLYNVSKLLIRILGDAQ